MSLFQIKWGLFFVGILITRHANQRWKDSSEDMDVLRKWIWNLVCSLFHLLTYLCFFWFSIECLELAGVCSFCFACFFQCLGNSLSLCVSFFIFFIWSYLQFFSECFANSVFLLFIFLNMNWRICAVNFDIIFPAVLRGGFRVQYFLLLGCSQFCSSSTLEIWK